MWHWDWSNDAENSGFPQKYITFYIFWDQINTALVNIRDNIKILPTPKRSANKWFKNMYQFT